MNYIIKNLILPILLALPLQHTIVAQCPTDGNLILWTQTDIDSFPIKYPGCKKIEGTVDIWQSSMHPGPPASDLTPLLGIDTVVGSLRIYVQDLIDLHGLDSLRFVGSDLEIGSGFGGGNFESLSGLDNLERVGGHFNIGEKFPELKNLHGLENLRSVGQEFQIHSSAMETLDGLDNLKKVGAFFDIRADSLHSLSGLGQLDTVMRGLYILYSKHLKNFQGLSNFKHGGIGVSTADSLVNLNGLESWQSGNYFWVTGCPLLESLNGVENLEELQTDAFPGVILPALWLENNLSLHDLSALNHPVSLSTGIRLKNNQNLSSCSVKAICDYLSTPLGSIDTIEIVQNMVNCNSDTEVLAFCMTANKYLAMKNVVDVSPNPISAGQPLKIFIETDFMGIIKFEIISLDGRMLYVCEKEKTALQQHFEIQDLPQYSHFFIRISENRSSTTRLVLKY
jgi:hypothetical protein